MLKDRHVGVKSALQLLVGPRNGTSGGSPDSRAGSKAQGSAAPGGPGQREDMSMLPPDQQSRWNTPGPDRSPQQPGRSKASRGILIALWAGALLVFIALLISSSHSTTTTSPESISYSTMLSKVSADSVKSVQINQSSGAIDGTFKDGKSFTAQGPPGGLPGADIALLNQHHVARNYVSTASSIWPTIITWGILIGLLVVFWVWIGRRSRAQMAGLTSWGKSGAKVHVTERPTTTFGDIAGYDGVKQEISELVEFLKKPDRFLGIGAHIPKGVLLVGPPGTGKTLLAQHDRG